MKKWSKVNANRLLKLAAHLEAWKKNKKKGHKIFDFEIISNGDTPGKCGTAGCAIGECPIVFPRDFVYNGLDIWKRVTVKLKGYKRHGFSAVAKFFGLTEYESVALFAPLEQGSYLDSIKWRGSSYPNLEELDFQATPKQVARNIRTFVKWKLKQ